MILFLQAPAGNPNRNRKLRAGVITLAIGLASVWLVFNPSPSPSPPGSAERETSWSRAGMMAELIISAIEVLPSVPSQQEPFSVNVFCQNIGIITSGTYAMRLTITGPDGREVFRSATEGKGALEPGQIGVGLSTTVDSVGPAGTYTVTVELHPENFEDENLANNVSTRSFQVE